MAQYITKSNGIGIRFYVERNGKKERISLYEKGWTKEDAENAMVDYRRSMGIVDAKDVTIENYLVKFYNDYVKQSVAETTQIRYDEFIALHIVPIIGNIKLQKIRPAEIQSMYTSLLNKGLSQSTVLKVHRFLHLALKYAISWGYILYNPCDGVKAPSQPKHEMVIPTDKEMTKILKETKGTLLYWPIYIGAVTGMRLGEICGLQEKSVDFETKKFIVQHTLKRINGRLVLKAPKTSGSRRPVPFLPGTIEEMKKYLKVRAANKLKYGEKKSPDLPDADFFLKNKFGRPMQPDDVSKYFRQLMRDMGMSDEITFHSLRHYHASWLLRQGVHPKVASERLGHASTSITLNLYSHLIPDMQEKVIKGLNCKVFNIGQK